MKEIPFYTLEAPSLVVPIRGIFSVLPNGHPAPLSVSRLWVPTSSPNSLISPWRGRKTTNMPPSEPVSASGEEICRPCRAVATIPREQAHPNCSSKVLTAGTTSHASLPFLCVPQCLVDAACSYNNCPAVAGLLTPRGGAP